MAARNMLLLSSWNSVWLLLPGQSGRFGFGLMDIDNP